MRELQYIREQNPMTPSADFIANLGLNTGVNANWRLTGQGEMFNPESSVVETGMQALWAVYQQLGEKEWSLLVEVARAFAGAETRSMVKYFNPFNESRCRLTHIQLAVTAEDLPAPSFLDIEHTVSGASSAGS